MAIRHGMHRITFLLWGLGALLLLALPAESIFSPYENVCVDRSGPSYPECYSQKAQELERRIAESHSEADKVLAMLDDKYQEIDASKHVRRVETERYRFALKFLAGAELALAALVWGLFYLLAWVISGFRKTA